MAGCHDMKVGEVWVCPDCGLELKVVAGCHDAGKPDSDCEHKTPCLVCCDKPLALKKKR
jgi:hypothetical protein